MDPGRLILIQSINLFFLTTNFPINEESWAKEPAIPLHRIPLDSVSVVIDSVYAFAMTCSYGQSIYSQGCRIDPQDPHMCPAGSGPLLHRLLYAHHTLVFRAPAFPGTTVPRSSTPLLKPRQPRVCMPHSFLYKLFGNLQNGLLKKNIEKLI